MNGADTEGWRPLRQAADVVRGQLKRPGDYHRARAAATAERLMGIKLGAAQKEVLGVWGEVHGKASGTLHSGVADPARAAALYRQLLAAARELLVPLPGRAARVLELAALTVPSEEEARELAGWADPRATAFFFRSGLAAAWLPLLLGVVGARGEDHLLGGEGDLCHRSASAESLPTGTPLMPLQDHPIAPFGLTSGPTRIASGANWTHSVLRWPSGCGEAADQRIETSPHAC